MSWKYSKTFLLAKISYPQIIIILKTFQEFSACKIALAANHHHPENIQRLFRVQNCLRRKISLSWKYSKTFSPAKLSYFQIILILKKFKDFFACKIVLAANLRYPEKIQRLFRLQICLFRKSSLSWKYSKTFSPAKLSWPQIIKIFENFEDFFAGKIILAASLRYPENIQRHFRLQNCLRRNSSLSWEHSKTFRLHNCLSRKTSLSWDIQRLLRQQNCLICKSSFFWKYSKTFPPQIWLRRKSSFSWNYSKIFSPTKLS